MDEAAAKHVDESWKEQAEREKQAQAPPSAPGQPSQPGQPRAARAEGFPEARFDLFVSGLVVEAFVALGDMPHPASRKQAVNLPQAKYLIDLVGIIAEKTKGNLSVDEEKGLTDALYQLRMRYLAKSS